jgi:hypothetical protein
MGKDHYDAIAASTPLTRTAARVASKGFEYTPAKKVTNNLWTAPPPMRKLKRNEPHLAGTVFGRLTVIAPWAEHDGHNGRTAWVCRCACGNYVTRSSKAIRNPLNNEDRCELCRHAKFLAQQASGDRPRLRAESEKAKKW